MYPFTPVTNASDSEVVGVGSQQFGVLTMVVGNYYLFVSSTACWIKQGSNPTATAADGSMYVPANTPICISGNDGAKLAVIQDAAGGKASLTPVRL